MKYKIIQMKLTDEQIEIVNTPSKSEEMSGFYKIYRDANMFPNKEKIETALAADMYDHVANIEADNLDDVFHIGNQGPWDRVEYVANKFGRNMHSISVGDIVEREDGNRYFVDFTGFGEL